MKDKYKETIYNLVHLNKAKMSFDGIYIDSNKLKQDINNLWELYNKYQKLVNKATPNVFVDQFGIIKCGNCKEPITHPKYGTAKYCLHCGQAVNWSEKDA